MMKKYASAAFVYAIAAMAGGVFYREFTKIIGFTGETALSVVHTHYFMMGMVIFLLLALLEKALAFTGKSTGRIVAVYHAGLNLTCVMLLVRGIMQALSVEMSRGLTASISGIAGIGHIMLGVSLVLLLNQIRKKA